MDNSVERINDLLLDLSLVTALPVGLDGRNYSLATASANALVCRTKNMTSGQLRELEYTVGPLITLMMSDIDNPVSLKAGFGLATLMPSRVCMAKFIELDGLTVVGKLLDLFLGSSMIDLQNKNPKKELTEHLFVIYREIARWYPHKLVPVGVIRHCVILLRFGDVALRTLACATLGMLSVDLDICKIMFNNAAIKPLLNACSALDCNAACLLSALGAIVQLCRIPLIGAKVVKQGAITVLEAALHRNSGYMIESIREKALYALAWLSKIPEVRSKITTTTILRGMKRELTEGTMPAKYTVVQMLLNLHRSYPGEEAFKEECRDLLIQLLFSGPWHAKNLVIKSICVLFKTLDDRMYLINNGIIDALYNLIESKNKDLQEVPMVVILSLLTHPEIPPIFIKRNGAAVIAQLLYAVDEVIRDLAIVILRALYLYDRDTVDKAIPADRAHLMARDTSMPSLYGSEFGGLIEEYLQTIVENRRDQHYLLEKITPEELAALNLTPKELESYENTFMELDFDLGGTLDKDEFKVLMIMMGEKLDKEELEEAYEAADLNKDGFIDFREFVIMMIGWKNRFGTGAIADKMYNKFTKHGTIGKARKAFANWWDRDRIEKEQIEAVKAKKKAAEEERKALAAQHWDAEKVRLQREQEIKLRKQAKKEQMRNQSR